MIEQELADDILKRLLHWRSYPPEERDTLMEISVKIALAAIRDSQNGFVSVQQQYVNCYDIGYDFTTGKETLSKSKLSTVFKELLNR